MKAILHRILHSSAMLVLALLYLGCAAPPQSTLRPPTPRPTQMALATVTQPAAAVVAAASLENTVTLPAPSAQPSLLPTAIAARPPAQKVVIISLDGARPDAIQNIGAPQLLALAARGAVDWNAQTTIPPVTLPAHASMLTGLDVVGHGIDFNDDAPFRPALERPTFLSLAQTAGLQAAMVVGKEKFALLAGPASAITYDFIPTGDSGVTDRAIELLREDYDVIFIHFPNPDFFGHRSGWMSTTYLHQLLETDRNVGRIVDVIAERDAFDDTLIIVTADHGGHGFVHGSDIPEDMDVPWIAAGSSVLANTVLPAYSVRVWDTAATVLWALGLPLPDSLDGEPVYAAFGFE